jgi:uncharacterized protein (DUF362 family)/NAD-dependent dihydropyrimidine dehydrogenase PreA subunit
VSKVFYIGNNSYISTGEKVRRILHALGGLGRWVKPGYLVLIKPNFVAPLPDSATSFEILEAIVDGVRGCGGRPVIGESSGFEFDTATTLRVLGAYDFARRNDVQLVNLDVCDFTSVKLHNGLIKEVKISALVQQADVLINVPKLKRHSVTGVTLAMKNLFGLLARESRRKLHALGLERGIFELTRVIKSDLVIADGSVVKERAVYGAKRPLGIVVGGTDVYAVDKECCRFMQVDYRGVAHINFALRQGLARQGYQAVSLSQRDTLEDFHLTPINQEDSIWEMLHRLSYQLIYLSDIPYAWLSKGKSLIPRAHFYLGTRPKIDPKKCTECGDCVPVCPVNAIQIPGRRIIPSQCMRVRCLECVRICPESAIRVLG